MLTSKLPNVGTTIFTRMSQLAAESGALNLSQGFPDFDGPAPLLEAVGRHVAAGNNQYAPMTGLPALREQVAIKVAQPVWAQRQRRQRGDHRAGGDRRDLLRGAGADPRR